MAKKIQMTRDNGKTLGEVYQLYLLDAKARNLREGTFKHYDDAMKQIFKRIPEETKVAEIDSDYWDDFRISLSEDAAINDVSAYTYSRDLKTILHFAMKEGFMAKYDLPLPKADKAPTETYTESELKTLLKKPNLKRCNFTEYKSWVIVNFLLSTGVRQNSLINIRVGDLDLDAGVVYINITKNRKPLIIPLNRDMAKILEEYLKYRKPTGNEDFLFCNEFGLKLCRSTLYAEMWNYNKNRGVEKTGIHRYRHTCAKEWVLMGGNVVSLQKLLGHSSLEITQNYLNMLTTDVAKDVEEFNLLRKIKGDSLKMR